MSRITVSAEGLECGADDFDQAGQQPLTFSPTDRQIADELADVFTYLDLLAAALHVNLGIAAAEKFNEVSARVGFPDRIDVR